MNIYDPMDRIVYRHLDQQRDSSVGMTSMVSVNPLPRGYANRSPRTYLGRSRRASQAA